MRSKSTNLMDVLLGWKNLNQLGIYPNKIISGSHLNRFLFQRTDLSTWYHCYHPVDDFNPILLISTNNLIRNINMIHYYFLPHPLAITIAWFSDCQSYHHKHTIIILSIVLIVSYAILWSGTFSRRTNFKWVPLRVGTFSDFNFDASNLTLMVLVSLAVLIIDTRIFDPSRVASSV